MPESTASAQGIKQRLDWVVFLQRPLLGCRRVAERRCRSGLPWMCLATFKAFWKVTNDGREIHMVIHQDERGPESGQMDERIFEYRGVQLSTVLRYRVP